MKNRTELPLDPTVEEMVDAADAALRHAWNEPCEHLPTRRRPCQMCETARESAWMDKYAEELVAQVRMDGAALKKAAEQSEDAPSRLPTVEESGNTNRLSDRDVRDEATLHHVTQSPLFHAFIEGAEWARDRIQQAKDEPPKPSEDPYLFAAIENGEVLAVCSRSNPVAIRDFFEEVDDWDDGEIVLMPTQEGLSRLRTAAAKQ